MRRIMLQGTTKTKVSNRDVFFSSFYSNTLTISPISFLLSCDTKGGGGYKHEGEGGDKEGGQDNGGRDKGEGDKEEGGQDKCDGTNDTEGECEYIFYIIFNIYQTQMILLSLVLFFM